MKTIRASEIGAYLYCQRAWWYQLQGNEPENQDDMASGRDVHAKHTRSVLASGCLRALAYVFLLATLVILTIYFTNRIF